MLSSTLRIQYLSLLVIHATANECRGIYHDFLEVYALDVCTDNTLLTDFPLTQKYVCENETSFHQFWIQWNTDNGQCNDIPDTNSKLESDNVICDGDQYCPFAIMRTYSPNNDNCDDNGQLWSDRALIYGMCQTQTNNINSSMLECDSEGLIAKSYSGQNCEGLTIEENVIMRANECVTNDDGTMSKFLSCNERSNATNIPTNTPTNAPTINSTSEVNAIWYILGIVFICLFGGLACVAMVSSAVWIFCYNQGKGNEKNVYVTTSQDENA